MSRWGLPGRRRKAATRAAEAADRPSMDVSVVMPVGSVDQALVSALDHLGKQITPFAWELVIALNTDATDDRVALENHVADLPFPTRIIDASAVRSASFARNTGAAAATGSKLVFCDADDEVDLGWLANIVTALVPATAIGGHLDERRLVVAGQENWRPPATPGALPSFLGAKYLVSANMAVWADDFRAVRGFDETLIRGEDLDFSWKLLEAGVDLRYEPSAVVHYRHRAGLKPLLQQHYLYGRGMAQALARRPPPGSSANGSRLLRANGQRVEHQSAVHVLRRGAIAAGRMRGLLDARGMQSAE